MHIKNLDTVPGTQVPGMESWVVHKCEWDADCLAAGLTYILPCYHTVPWHRQAGQGFTSPRLTCLSWASKEQKRMEGPTGPLSRCALLSHPLWGWPLVQPGSHVQAARGCFPALLLFPSIPQPPNISPLSWLSMLQVDAHYVQDIFLVMIPLLWIHGYINWGLRSLEAPLKDQEGAPNCFVCESLTWVETTEKKCL